MVIEKLFKKPSLLASAKHYRVEYEKGNLYVLQMSKARPDTNLGRNSLNGAIANKMLDNFEAKFNAQYDAALSDLANIGKDAFALRKSCFVISNASKENFILDLKHGSCEIKSNSNKVKLYIRNDEQRERLIAIYNNL